MLSFKEKITIQIEIEKTPHSFDARTYLGNGNYLDVGVLFNYRQEEEFKDYTDEVITKEITIGDLIFCIKQDAIDEMKNMIKKSLDNDE